MITHTIVKRATATGRNYITDQEAARRLAIEFVVDAVGATPTITYTIQGCPAGNDPTVAANWIDIAYVTGDATVAASKAAVTVTAVGESTRYLTGLDLRFFHAIGVNVTANTNVTYSVFILREDNAP